jgi:hypothetical protein
LDLELEDRQVFVRPNRATIDGWLRSLAVNGPNSFAALVQGCGDYIQTATRGTRFVIEQRTQQPLHHYRAIRTADSSDLFEIEEVVEAFEEYAFSINTPSSFTWELMDAEVGI